MSSLFLLQVRGDLTGFAESDLNPSFETELRESSSDCLTLGASEQIPLIEFARRLRETDNELRFSLHKGPVYRMETRVDPTRRILDTLSKMAPSACLLATEVFCNELELGMSALHGWSLRYLDESRLKPGTPRHHILELYDGAGEPLSPSVVGSASIPERRGHLFGREDFLREITRTTSEHKKVNVWGTSGIGKTRLVREYAHRIWESGPRRTIQYLDFSRVETRDDLFEVFATQMRVNFSSSDRDPVEVVSNIVARMHDPLFVLDGVDRLFEWWTDLSQMFEGTDCLFVSRQPITDEDIYRIELREMSDAAAIELFWVAARRVRPGFEVTDGNIEVIRELTRSLEGNPAAIEVAARSLRLMNVEGLLDDVEQQRESGSIEGSILDSAFLPERLSEAAELLELFDGPFGRDTAVEFLNAVDLSGDPSELFESLVERGLLRTVEPDNENIPPLFERTGGGYSPKQVDDISSKAGRMFANCYCQKASVLRGKIWGPDEPAVIQRLEVEYDNFRRALDLGIEYEVEGLADIGLMLAEFHYLRGLFGQRAQFLDDCVAVARNKGDVETEIRLEYARLRMREHLGSREAIGDVVGQLSDRVQKLEAPKLKALDAYWRAWTIAHERNQTKSIRSLIEEALGHISKSENLALWTKISVSQLRLMVIQSDLRGFTDTAETAVEVARQLGRPSLLSNALRFFGYGLRKLDRLREASAKFEEATDIARRLRADRHILQLHHDSGEVAKLLGDSSRAYRQLKMGYRLAGKTGDLSSTIGGMFSLNLGGLALQRCDIEAARTYLERGIEVFEKLDRRHPLAHAAGRLAAVEAYVGRRKESQDRFEQMQEVLKQLDIPAADSIQDYYRSLQEVALQLSTGNMISMSEQFEQLWPDEAPDNPDLNEIIDIARGLIRHSVASEPTESKTDAYVYFGDKIRFPSGYTVDFSSHGAPRRILKALVDQRIEHPGDPVPTFDLIEQAWPDENLEPATGRNRIYVAINRLRDMGLDGLINNEQGGYYLSTEYSIRRVSPG